MYGSSNVSTGIREEQNAREATVRRAQAGIEKQFAGFDDSFYKSREKAYLGYALPELAEQYQEAQRDLTFSLAGKGLLRSGAAGTLATSLQRELHKKKQAVADTAISKSNELRMNVEDEQTRLLSQAMQALDPGATVIAARKTASRFEEPSSMAPIGSMFRDWTSMYATKTVADAYADQEPITWSPSRKASYNVGS